MLTQQDILHRAGSQHSSGILELGGASTQIAFIPDGSILADKFPVKIAGTTYAVYVHSYLYYGQNYVVKRIRERLQEKDPNAYRLDNPCMLKGGCHESVPNLYIASNYIPMCYNPKVMSTAILAVKISFVKKKWFYIRYSEQC